MFSAVGKEVNDVSYVTYSDYDQLTADQREDFRVLYNMIAHGIRPTREELARLIKRGLDPLNMIGRMPLPGMPVQVPVGAP